MQTIIDSEGQVTIKLSIEQLEVLRIALCHYQVRYDNITNSPPETKYAVERLAVINPMLDSLYTPESPER